MRYTVVWAKSALNALAELWTLAPNRQLVSEQANAIDRELSENAHLKGKQAREGLYQFILDSMAVMYTINEADRIVEIVEIVGFGIVKKS